MTTTKKRLSESKLAMSREYREAFVSAFLKRYIPFQVRTLRKKKNISQQQLAKDAKVTQGVISRAEDPDYGNLTFNTVLRIASGFDLAFVGKFVRFSDFLNEVDEMSEDSMELLSFLDECKQEAGAAAGFDDASNQPEVIKVGASSQEPAQEETSLICAKEVAKLQHPPHTYSVLDEKTALDKKPASASASIWNEQDQHSHLPGGAGAPGARAAA